MQLRGMNPVNVQTTYMIGLSLSLVGVLWGKVGLKVEGFFDSDC